MINLKSVKTQLIIYLSLFAFLLIIQDRDFTFLKVILAALLSAIALESVVLYFKNKRLEITESSIITGLIIGYVLSAEEALWKVILASFAAILSKQILRFKNKHIFNPASFGIFLAIVLSGAYTGWKGTYLWYILIPLGFYFTYKIRKLEVIAGYAVISFLLFGTQAFLQKVPLRDIFGYFSYFYIFVMLIEPKTTPIKPMGKYLFGAGAAALIFILTETGMKFDVELLSLLVMNATVPLLNKLSTRKGGAG
ncbi:MAG TPA: RnfABCDGE type electron transport complex subunit D [Candidatus Margulisiibacteriota bacterium]|nr:RnfABCDGE type electron transport complex subunit D [Candidatus Margulisiibacteriota bacterium]